MSEPHQIIGQDFDAGGKLIIHQPAAPLISPEQCVAIGGHCFHRDPPKMPDSVPLIYDLGPKGPAEYPETCRHCGKKRVAIEQESFKYRDA